ncbi:serine/threonine protein kinase, CMGC, CDC2/CDK sub [Podochytrium sp. JEL0797]|nr:serine/threonine protein kinase, CMGC, CDC2/CDK sub [Podochytrium sp. JEL0797]
MQHEDGEVSDDDGEIRMPQVDHSHPRKPAKHHRHEDHNDSHSSDMDMDTSMDESDNNNRDPAPHQQRSSISATATDNNPPQTPPDPPLPSPPHAPSHHANYSQPDDTPEDGEEPSDPQNQQPPSSSSKKYKPFPAHLHHHHSRPSSSSSSSSSYHPNNNTASPSLPYDPQHDASSSRPPTSTPMSPAFMPRSGASAATTPRPGDAAVAPVMQQQRVYKGCSSIDEYVSGKKVGEGTFGEVMIMTHSKTGKVYALKKILMHNEKEGIPITALREIKILKSLCHENVVELTEIAVKKGNKQSRTRGEVHMVFPFMDHDLNGLLENPSIRFMPHQIKSYFQQLLKGTDYLHKVKNFPFPIPSFTRRS